MGSIIIRYFSFEFGELVLGSYDGELCLCDWRYRKMRTATDRRMQDGLNSEYVEGDSPVIQMTQKQLGEYAQGNREIFTIPLRMVGTDFQKQVWHALINIPFGQTETYLGLSKKLGNAKAIRAIASANGANALGIIVPCHRVIGSKGELVGYAGGLPVKRDLLKLEKVDLDPNQGKLFPF